MACGSKKGSAKKSAPNSYTKDTLEVVVDSTGTVTAMYFITAE